MRFLWAKTVTLLRSIGSQLRAILSKENKATLLISALAFVVSFLTYWDQSSEKIAAECSVTGFQVTDDGVFTCRLAFFNKGNTPVAVTNIFPTVLTYGAPGVGMREIKYNWTKNKEPFVLEPKKIQLQAIVGKLDVPALYQQKFKDQGVGPANVMLKGIPIGIIVKASNCNGTTDKTIIYIAKINITPNNANTVEYRLLNQKLFVGFGSLQNKIEYELKNNIRFDNMVIAKKKSDNFEFVFD